jgi:hypothetical protein
LLTAFRGATGYQVDKLPVCDPPHGGVADAEPLCRPRSMGIGCAGGRDFFILSSSNGGRIVLTKAQ